MDEDAVMAAVDLVGRTGAKGFELGYLHDDVPTEEAGWYAWAAGFIDGEAHISFSSRRAAIDVHQASHDNAVPQVLERLQHLFGGRIGGPRYNLRHPHRLPMYEWRLGRRGQIEATLRAVWPWLGEVKREQARTALAQYVDPDKKGRQVEARARWDSPQWREAHPKAVANAKRFADAPKPYLQRDAATGRFRGSDAR